MVWGRNIYQTEKAQLSLEHSRGSLWFAPDCSTSAVFLLQTAQSSFIHIKSSRFYRRKMIIWFCFYHRTVQNHYIYRWILRFLQIPRCQTCSLKSNVKNSGPVYGFFTVFHTMFQHFSVWFCSVGSESATFIVGRSGLRLFTLRWSGFGFLFPNDASIFRFAVFPGLTQSYLRANRLSSKTRTRPRPGLQRVPVSSRSLRLYEDARPGSAHV